MYYTTQYIIFTVIIYVTLYFMGLQFIDNLNKETTREFPSKNQLEKVVLYTYMYWLISDYQTKLTCE